MWRARNTILHIMAVCFAFAAAGCAGAPAEHMVNVNPEGWGSSGPAEITVPNEDTVSLRRLDLLLVYNDNFKEKKIPLLITVTTPDGTYYTEEFTMVPEGKPRKRNDHYESRTGYRDSVRLDQQGVYIFKLAPSRTLRGIQAIGVSLE